MLTRPSTTFARQINSRFQAYFVYANMPSVFAQSGKMDEAEAASPKLVASTQNSASKWMIDHTGNTAAVHEGLRQAGMPEK
jgi:hypothetical protein